MSALIIAPIAVAVVAKNGRDIGPRGFVSGRQADLPPLAAQRYQKAGRD